ncbi:MAG: flagellar export chaperone FlgN [Acidimicrobiales bacterium]|nr:flagellar export chaperone FlgN [Acidimicrobiales bacterium]
MERLAEHLSAEQRLLETLLFRLVEAHHLLVAGETRFLAWAADEVGAAVEEVRRAELLRAAHVQAVGARLGLADGNPTLAELAERSPEPYRSILDGHRRSLADLLAEIDEVGALNRELAADDVPSALVGGARP